MSEQNSKRAAIGLSLLLHLVAMSALAGWSDDTVVSRVRFAGRNRAIQLTATLSQPPTVPDSVTFDTARDPELVVIEPRTARIAKQRTVHTPTADVMKAELTAILHLDRQTESPPRLTRQEPAVHEPTESPSPRRPTLRRRTPRPVRARTTASQPPSQAGTSKKTPPDFSKNAPPTYPVLAIQRGWQGTVLLRVVVGADGTIKSVKVARSSGYSILDGRAVNAVRQWKGRPAMRGDIPVETVELLPVQFKL